MGCVPQVEVVIRIGRNGVLRRAEEPAWKMPEGCGDADDFCSPPMTTGRFWGSPGFEDNYSEDSFP